MSHNITNKNLRSAAIMLVLFLFGNKLHSQTVQVERSIVPGKSSVTVTVVNKSLQPLYYDDALNISIHVRNYGELDSEPVKLIFEQPAGIKSDNFSDLPNETIETQHIWYLGVLPGNSTKEKIITFTSRFQSPEIIKGDSTIIFISAIFENEVEMGEYECKIRVRERAKPDLIAELAKIMRPGSPDYPFSIKAKIKNVAAAKADSIVVGFYIDDLNTKPVALDTIPFLEWRDSTKVAGIWPNATKGPHQVYVFVDRLNRIHETEENNNIDSTQFSVGIESLNVNVVNVTISDTIRNKVAHFPDNVISQVSVYDQNGWPILGLADTTKWLSLEDISLSGQAVNKIWAPLFEYHREDSTYPANSLLSDFRITEISTIMGDTSDFAAALVMDYSGSMAGQTETAEGAAEDLVNYLRQKDKVAVIKFASSSRVKQTFTQDKNKVKIAISDGTAAAGGTALYDALISGISLTSNQVGSRAVVAYTDGVDTGSSHSINAVINHSQTHNVPVYIIGVGASVNNPVMEKIAQNTGGQYFPVTEAEDLAPVYLRIATMMQNYYAIAHTTPDPEKNGKWRTVDVTVNFEYEDENLVGRDTGFYKAPIRDTDILVTCSSIADSVLVTENRIFKYVYEEQLVQYSITAKNQGSEVAKEVQLKNYLPDYLTVQNVRPEPAEKNESLLTWEIPKLRPGQATSFNFDALVDAEVPLGMTRLINRAESHCSTDTILFNNTCSDTVFILRRTDSLFVCPDIQSMELEPIHLITNKNDPRQGDIQVTIINSDTISSPACELNIYYTKIEEGDTSLAEVDNKLNNRFVTDGVTYLGSYQVPELEPDSTNVIDIKWETSNWGKYRFFAETTVDTSFISGIELRSKKKFSTIYAIPKWDDDKIEIAVQDTFNVKINRYREIEVPIVPMVFFDSGSDSVATEYYDKNILTAPLPVIAERLRANAQDTLLITGFNDSTETERNLPISSRRAISVKQELISLGVEREQLTIKPAPDSSKRRIRPQNVQSAFTELIAQENRRVELSSMTESRQRLFGPDTIIVSHAIDHQDTTYDIPKFRANIVVSAPYIKDWNLEIRDMQHDSLMTKTNNPAMEQGNIIKGDNLTWHEIVFAADSVVFMDQPFTCFINVRDSSENGIRSFKTPIDTIYLNEKETVIKDQIFSLFKFDTTETSFIFYQKRRVDSVINLMADIDDDFEILFEGHADTIGTEERNDILAQERADTTKKVFLDFLDRLIRQSPDNRKYSRLKDILERAETKGYSSKESLFLVIPGEGRILIGDNTKPIGRNLNRRVVLKVYQKHDAIIYTRKN